jgi:hypothetical protein
MTHCLLLSFFNLPGAIYYMKVWRRVASLGLVNLAMSLGPQRYLLLPCHFLKSFIRPGTQFSNTAIEIPHNGCAPFKGTGGLGSWIPCVRLAILTILAAFITCWLWQQIVTQSACQPLVTEPSFPDVKRTKRKADYWPPSSAEEKSEYAVGTVNSL